MFGSLEGLAPEPGVVDRNVPLVSVLRDTLGDADPENDRLRYVWMLTYTRPTFGQRVASAVPLLYRRTGGRTKIAPDQMPPALIDLAAPRRDVWQRFMWAALQNVLFEPYGVVAKSSARSLRRNAEDFRKANVIQALALLSLYEQEAGVESVFTRDEMSEMQGRLLLKDKTLGGYVNESYLPRLRRHQAATSEDLRGHNWELLRQRAEAEGLYFEPLQLPDGSATHALVWIAREDLEKQFGRAYDNRFLNIADPWRDKRLHKWDGYSETRFYDSENRRVAEGEAGARSVELIPLALYGLDNPTIPALLVDFRDARNPKKREVSRRALEDVTQNLLSLSRFGSLHYFLGRTLFDIVTGRRGMDINQPTRLRAYTQLKLLLALDASLDPDLRAEISRRAERLSTNPLDNELDAQARLARAQYAALIAYARRPDGLSARIDRARRGEMLPLNHGRREQFLFKFANIISFGLYNHREGGAHEELVARLDTTRRVAYHRRFLREVSKSSPLVEVVWDMEEVRRSLRFIAENGSRADATTAAAAARIFAHTADEETRRLCLNSLYRIDNETAKRELLHIYQTPELDPSLRNLSAQLLRRAVREEQRINPADARVIVTVVGP